MRHKYYHIFLLDKVSIHASVKDATFKRFLPEHLSGVSIHASVKDATFNDVLCSIGYMWGFNPRICKRCDWSFKKLHQQHKVSIHASVKDATKLIILMPIPLCFNPRICKRCDYTDEFCNPFKRVSIHASVKDATFGLRYWWRISFVSIHASVKDATSQARYRIDVSVFQSTHL